MPHAITDSLRAKFYADYINGETKSDEAYDLELRQFYDGFKKDPHAPSAPPLPNATPIGEGAPIYAESLPTLDYYRPSPRTEYIFLPSSTYPTQTNITNVYPGAANSNQQKNANDKNNTADFASYMFALILVAGISLPLTASLYYFTSVFVDIFERFWYNEGYLLAILSFYNILLSLAISTWVINTLLSPSIISLCISAGFANPITWAFFILGGITLAVGAILHLFLQDGLHHILTYFNQKELNPMDPHRFSITEAEYQKLDSLHSRDDIQNVITAIHHGMKGQEVLHFRPLFFSPTRESLQKIRTLRNSGHVDFESIKIKGQPERLHFKF